ncbi:zinc metalloprotease HtpX [Gloeocapsa sp. PCC 73106]|uniref:zinc metalloprotease HtpX n=1 Tax=Gloeocapsa sp. PCC 73106 TaxID=102232 RepID=UPI0002ACAA96|nr:zinc metalloprotease HtpX [Gloeocapsa sp. PCC 73106]ELS00182.1 Zn-dependent protease with chaperone function [Gloeocapsa sp. PCC 73106]
MSLKMGLKAVEEQRYAEAVEILGYFCQNCFDYKSHEYLQGKIGLARAYYGLGEREQVVYICQELIGSDRLSVRQWAQQWLNSIQAIPKYTLEELQSILNTGHQALKEKNYPLAIKSLEEYCQHNHQVDLREHQEAKMWLIQAYAGTRDLDAAISVCEELNFSHDTMIQQWAKEKLPSLKFNQNKQKQVKYSSDATYIEAHSVKEKSSGSDLEAKTTIKANYLKQRATETDIRLKMPKIGGSLTLAMLITLILIFLPTFSLVFAISWTTDYIFNLGNFNLVLLFAGIVTVLINLIVFWLSPQIIDFIQARLYSIRWVPITEIGYHSSETAEVIERICSKYQLKTPRLGVIDQPIPIAFSYGAFPHHQTRLVVSQGLFAYLDEEEIATVYAHELGHIVNKDLMIMTLGYGFMAIINLIRARWDKPLFPAFIYTLATYSLFYLSRTREYHADHIATQITGNPNALIRALTKIAYGIVEENERSEKVSNLLRETRVLGIYDPYLALATGIVTEAKNLGKTLVWDMFNPWANWVQLNATHPLTGKRFAALTDYVEQLGLNSEHNLIAVIAEGKKLNRQKLNHNFVLDLCLFNLPAIGVLLGILISLILYLQGKPITVLPSLCLLGLGIGILIKGRIMYPAVKKAKEADIISLVAYPYTSSLRSSQVKLSGELIGSKFTVQDATGIIYTRYVPLKGNKPNLTAGTQVKVEGWFRRGISPYLDLRELKTPQEQFKSYQGMWSLCVGLICVFLAGAIALANS